MKKTILYLFTVLYILPGFGQPATHYVDPFIGTGAHGHTYPGATVPFGMIQLSPDNGEQGWDWVSGYHYTSSTITGFSHTHLTGTGIGDLCDISVLPVVGEPADTAKLFSGFSHSTEVATPGYYKVHLDKYNINAELTTGLRYGVHRYTFPASDRAMIRFDLGFAINWDKPTDTYFKKINDSTFVGYRFSTGWAKDQRVYFAVRLNKPVKELVLFGNGQITNTQEVTAQKTIACLMFSTLQNEKVEMKVALSFANIEGAMNELNQCSKTNFERTREAALAMWETELSKVKVTTSDENLKRIFYTALYHAYQAPTVFNDVNGNYKGVNGKVEHSDRTVYSTHSLWDVFRAESPLFTILQTNRVSDIINSYLDFYKQHGQLPVWDLAFNETDCMTGYHAIPIVADAIMKNIPGIDVNLAYEAMMKSAMQNIRGTDVYRQYGYIPYDKAGTSVTSTYEYAYDDWCIAQVAKKLGKTTDYNTFMKRSQSWKELFDVSIGFARPKTSDGKWVEPFDPVYSEHDFGKAAFTEGNSWQHSWFVPQDVQGLINAFGGEAKFIKKLDSLFIISSQITGENVSPDISGLIGQYAHGNEPSHHTIYLYNYAGAAYKTAEKADQVMRDLYTSKVDGLCGNEDCGQMSAWYVFSSLGFYPVNAASGNYVFGRPMFNKVELSLSSGKKFIIEAKNNSSKNKYIQSATLNGKQYSKTYFTHKDIINGGKLVFVMGPQPNYKYGAEKKDRPF
ncbi:GH92 family glycosyl hydrolase [Pinibacter soli]|uniref:GH92 family glycosyl hydrolase n=1 Tax=Pinibacter soli TaxID=3044211 RepID=A0ABT6RH64_9BACT|nr:GH92 family glycosyl hydrolase [Pinibacter soli]MDI3321912.1 GH92 family glycosyl hydrolase [Pinibacter soli]